MKRFFVVLMVLLANRALAEVVVMPPQNQESAEGYRLIMARGVNAWEKQVGAWKPGAVSNLVFRSCGQKNAFFSRDTKDIVFCYEMATAAARGGDFKSAGAFVLYIISHELGHAIISAADRPFLGSEEDAADWVAASIARKSSDVVGYLSAVLSNREMAGKMLTLTTRSMAADSHSITQARRANLICIAGAGTPVLEDAVRRGEMPMQRARGCAAEAERAEAAVRELLQTP